MLAILQIRLAPYRARLARPLRARRPRGRAGHAHLAAYVDGLAWLYRSGFEVHVAARLLSGEAEGDLRAGFAQLFAGLGIGLDASDPARLMLSPDGRRPGRPGDHRGMLGHPGAFARRGHVLGLTHGGEAQGGVVARRGRLHPAALRHAFRARRDAGGGKPPGRAEPPALRFLLRARRGDLQPGVGRPLA